MAAALMPSARRIDCAKVGRALVARAQAAQQDAARRGEGQDLLKVVSVQVGELAPWAVGPRRHAQRVLEGLGVLFEARQLGARVTQNELLSSIAGLNADPGVHGVLVARPLGAAQLSIKQAQQAVHPAKDVEGMHPGSIGRLVYGARAGDGEPLYPCTARASVEVLRRGLSELGLGESLRGCEVLVVGSSDVLAKPIVSLLHAEGATVTVVGERTANLAAYARASDALVCAANCPQVVTGDMLKPGAVLVDLGLNVDSEGRFLCGDADLASCSLVAGKLTSLALGVGGVRSAVLFGNLVRAAELQAAGRSAPWST